MAVLEGDLSTRVTHARARTRAPFYYILFLRATTYTRIKAREKYLTPTFNVDFPSNDRWWEDRQTGG